MEEKWKGVIAHPTGYARSTNDEIMFHCYWDKISAIGLLPTAPPSDFAIITTGWVIPSVCFALLPEYLHVAGW